VVFFLLGNYFPTQVFNLGCPELLKFKTDLYKYAPVKYRIWFQNNMAKHNFTSLVFGTCGSFL